VPVFVRSRILIPLSRLFVALALVAGAQAVLAGGAFAVEPERDGSTEAIARAAEETSTSTSAGGGAGDREASGAGGQAAKPPAGGGSKSPRGYDISYPQCGAPYPADPAFGIVGVNGGRVFSVNPCLASQITWGGGAATELYINTGNPGPAVSSFWPNGQTTPRVCDGANPDTADCAYDYGWNAAKHSYETALAAYQQLGLTASPTATTWWLDVETSNSWRDETALNVAALEGEVAYLRSQGITKLGFYSTTVQWGVITGGSKVFAAYPSWGAGARNERIASSHCSSTTTSFTGGPLAMVQYPYSGFDANVRC
jgi:hypothetical protein